ncbi:MAG: hypothetical protein AABX32_04985 [Nanoarchaeota archaeon]
MNSIKVSLVNCGFSEIVDIKQYSKKPTTKITMRKYDAMRYLKIPKEENRYE